jgi:hypothetical protein
VYDARARLRHLAVPVWADPSDAVTADRAVVELGSAVEEIGRTPARITALASFGGELYAGTLDRGLWRVGGGEAVPLDGRERFVNALAVSNDPRSRKAVPTAERGGLEPSQGSRSMDRLWIGTYRGALAVDNRMRVRARAAGDAAVEAILPLDGRVWLGTSRGVVEAGGARPVAPALRASALAATGDRFYIGTPAGVYSVPLVGGLPIGPVPTRHPLVFGRPGAASNTVTALVAVGGGVLAATDDAGVAWLDSGGVRAARFGGARVHEGNPGAMLSDGESVWLGTQDGLLRFGRDGVSHALAGVEVSALTRDARGLVVGTGDGRVLVVRVSAAEPRS